MGEATRREDGEGDEEPARARRGGQPLRAGQDVFVAEAIT